MEHPALRTVALPALLPAHDCRRTAARNLIRASVPERVAMLLTGHKSRTIFDRDNIIHEQELLDAGDHSTAIAATAQIVRNFVDTPYLGNLALRPLDCIRRNHAPHCLAAERACQRPTRPVSARP